jgi:type IV pilus assembly protein PilB
MDRKKKLGELLMDEGLINEGQLSLALSYQQQWGGRLGSIIIKKGYVTEQDMISVLEKQLGISSISLEEAGKPSDDVLNMVKIDMAKKYTIFPVKFEKNSLLLAISDPTDLKMIDDINFMLGVRVKPLLALESDIQRSIAIYYEGSESPDMTYHLDKEKITEKISSTMPSGTIEQEIIRQSEPERPAVETPSQKKEVSQKTVLASTIDLLIAKGIFTREELINIIKSKKE